MNTFATDRCALGLGAAAALLAACGGSQPPIDAPGAMPQTVALATHADRGKSWMLPEAKRADLIYVTTYQKAVDVLTYPHGKLVGQFSVVAGAVGQPCADEKGDVFIPTIDENDSSGTIFEYRHGGTKPIARLSDPNPASACSIDPNSGDLAVANAEKNSVGSVSIYNDARGKAVIYSDSAFFEMSSCAYDNEGNLFVDGTNGSTSFELAELPSGSTSFLGLSISVAIGSEYAGMQWDGQYITLAVGDLKGTEPIYRLVVSGSDAMVVGTTELRGKNPYKSGTDWIGDDTVVAVAGKDYSDIGFWHYPSGRRPFRVAHIESSYLVGIVVSIAQR